MSVALIVRILANEERRAADTGFAFGGGHDDFNGFHSHFLVFYSLVRDDQQRIVAGVTDRAA
jgi:hypothetical protein